MTWLLDTNVVSELAKARADARVVAWAQARTSLMTYLSAITVFELELGVRQLERRDPASGAIKRLWLEKVTGTEWVGRILAVDGEVAAIAASLHVPDPRPMHDAFIAATALRHKLTVVTRKVKDFAPLGVRVFDPWA